MSDNRTGSGQNAIFQHLQQSRDTQAEQPEPEERPTGGTDESEAYEAEDSAEYEPEHEEEVEAESEYEEGEYEEGEEDYEEGREKAEEPQTYRVKVDGEEVEVDLDELTSGYQRDADYRKKTMDLAEKRKALEQQEQALSQKLQELESYLEQQDQSIDWDELRDTDPSEYLRLKEEHAKRREALDSAKKEQSQKQQEKFQELAQQEGSKLIEAMGGEKVWTPEKRQKDMQKAYSYLSQVGVSDEQANQIVDHRVWRMIFDAMQYQSIKANKGKVQKEVRKAPKSVKPGQRPAPSQRAMQEARDKVKSANKHNAIDALVNYQRAQRDQGKRKRTR